MIRFLAAVVVNLLANALGLWLTSLLLPGFHITVQGFLWTIIFFTVADLLLTPFILQLSIKYLPAIRGGIALVTTFVVLLLADIFTSGLSITGITTWLIAPLVVWISVLIIGILLPLVIFKNILKSRSDR